MSVTILRLTEDCPLVPARLYASIGRSPIQDLRFDTRQALIDSCAHAHRTRFVTGLAAAIRVLERHGRHTQVLLISVETAELQVEQESGASAQVRQFALHCSLQVPAAVAS